MAAILGKLSKRERILLYILLLILIITGMVYLLLIPAVDRNNKLSRELLDLQSQEMIVRHNIAGVDTLNKNVESLRESFKKENESIIPILTNDEIDLLVSSLVLDYNMAPSSLNISNGYLKQILPFEESLDKQDNRIYTSVVTLKLAGTLIDLTELFDYIETIKSIRVINYSVASNGKGTMGGDGSNWTMPIVVTLTLELYMNEEGTAKINDTIK